MAEKVLCQVQLVNLENGEREFVSQWEHDPEAQRCEVVVEGSPHFIMAAKQETT